MSEASSLYVDKPTIIHRLNGRAKLALAAGVSIAAFVFTDPIAIIAVLAIAFGTLLAVGGLRNLRRVWFIIFALFAVALFVWPVFTPAAGPIVIDTPFLRLSLQEVQVAVGRSARLVTFIIVGLGFVTTTRNEELVGALRALGVPFAFCFAVGTALRLFPTFLGAANTVRQAQAARGHEVTSPNPVARLRSYVPLLIPVFMTAFRNVHMQSMALEARGFDTRRKRTFYNRQSFSVRDWAAVVVAAVIALGSITLVLLEFGTI